MSAVLPIARATLEGILQRRVVLALVALPTIVLAGSALAFSHLGGLTIRVAAFFGGDTAVVAGQLLILLMFLWSGVLAVIASFAPAVVVAGDIASGETSSILARPVRRAELLLGTWLGLAVAVATFGALVSGAQILVAVIAAGFVPADSPKAVVFVTVHALVVLTVGVALATRLTIIGTAVTTLLLFAIAWTGGVIAGIGAWTQGTTLVQVGSVTKLLLPSDAVWRGALAMLEPGGIFSGARSVTMGANPLFATDTPPPELFLGYAVAWMVVILGVSFVAFRARDL